MSRSWRIVLLVLLILSPSSQTSVCPSASRAVQGRPLTPVDAPTDPNSSAFSSELLRCLEECAPETHGLLLVLKVEENTSQEQAVVDLVLQKFSPENLQYMTVVFRHGENDPFAKTIREWAQDNSALRNLLQKCGNCCHEVDPPDWRNQEEIYQKLENQAQDLLDTIELLRTANRGSSPTAELLQDRSLWSWFWDAPLGYQILTLLGAAGAGYLVITTVPWVKASVFVVTGTKNGAVWIWQRIPTTEQIKKFKDYCSNCKELYEEVKPFLWLPVA